jgi:hypothetical protein
MQDRNIKKEKRINFSHWPVQLHQGVTFLSQVSIMLTRWASAPSTVNLFLLATVYSTLLNTKYKIISFSSIHCQFILTSHSVPVFFKASYKTADDISTAITRAHISGRQTPGSTRGSPPFYITNVGGKLRVKRGVWRPEMWAQHFFASYDIRPESCLPISSPRGVLLIVTFGIVSLPFPAHKLLSFEIPEPKFTIKSNRYEIQQIIY